MTAQFIYNKINRYGKSLLWQIDIAKEIGVSKSTASRLCQIAGYHYHKREKIVTLAEFSAHSLTQRICKMLP